jgi:uncharacterized protein
VPSVSTINPAALLALMLMFLGLVGAIVPVIPGAALIWLGALVWALGENFQHVTVLTLIALGVLALLATLTEFWLTPLTQRRAGFGWKNIVAAFVGGILGGIFLSELPIIGTLFGAAIGSVLGTMSVTLIERHSVRQALSAGSAYLIGCALSAIVEVGFSLLMLLIFAWRAFLA